MEHLWRWYCELGGARTSNGFGLNPLSFVDIKAWAELSGIEPTPWEVRVLKRLDLTTLASQRNKTSAPGEEEPQFEVGADDTEGVKGIFAIFKARAAVAYGQS